MSREIRFRAWDKRRKVMLYPPLPTDSLISARVGSPDGEPLRISDGTGTRTFPGLMTWDGRCYIEGAFQDLEWLQFTGMKDRHGRDIYEGDIVKGYRGDFVAEVIGVVKYCGMAFAFEGIKEDEKYALSGGSEDTYWFYAVTNPWIKQLPEIEIIGNVHESPELVGK